MSILGDVKEYLGIPAEVDCFDNTLLVHINTATFLTETISSFVNNIEIDKSTDWNEMYDGMEVTCPAIKTYVFLKIRLLFDPPNNSYLSGVIERSLTELEFKINMYCDSWDRAQS